MTHPLRPSRNFLLALTLVGVAAGMVGLSFASVPLYRLFCQITGYGGTTQRAQAAPDRVLDREIVVRLDANVSGLPWNFAPEVPQVHVKLGETALVNFIAVNNGSAATTGTATFNVEPEQAGRHFNKIQCFCFTEQTLKGGQSVDMPVIFFVDPKIRTDPATRNIDEITLSYTFYPVESRRAGR